MGASRWVTDDGEAAASSGGRAEARVEGGEGSKIVPAQDTFDQAGAANMAAQGTGEADQDKDMDTGTSQMGADTWVVEHMRLSVEGSHTGSSVERRAAYTEEACSMRRAFVVAYQEGEHREAEDERSPRPRKT